VLGGGAGAVATDAPGLRRAAGNTKSAPNATTATSFPADASNDHGWRPISSSNQSKTTSTGAFFDFKNAEHWHLDIGQIPPAAGFHTLHVVLARRRLMVLRNAHPDATRFSAVLSMIEIFRSG
jgi:hypothetical protein